MATSTLGNGTLVLAGTTSGTTTVTATAVAGTTTLTLPAATDTLVGKATTDTLTNKTLTGAAMNGTVGATTPSTGAFTTLTSTGASSFATSSGDVGIGTSSPTSRLHVSNSTASTNAIAQFTNGTTGTGAGNGLYVGVDTSNEATVFNFYNSALKFGTNAAERMRLDSSGNLGIGTTSTTSVRLVVKGSTSNGTSNALKLIDSADADIMSMSTAGDFYLPKMGSSTGTTVVLTSANYLVKSSSSIRFKKDVEPIDIGLNFVLGLNPVKYKMKLDDANQVGFIAEDFPDERLVSFSLVNPQDKQSELQRESVNYANLAAPLVKAIQEQQALITQLTARITALETA